MKLYGKKFRFCYILMDSLELLRKKIDAIDGSIIDLFVERFSIVGDIWTYKKNHKLPILDKIRRTQALQKRVVLGKKKWLPTTFITEIRNIIHKQALKIQQ